MSEISTPVASPIPSIGTVTVHEFWSCLKAGVTDFRVAPQFGLFFSAVYVLSGFSCFGSGQGMCHGFWRHLLGFRLVAPFAAVRLYEVSRRLEAGVSLKWRAILGVVWQERTRQVPLLGAVIVLYFLFWTFLAYMILRCLWGEYADQYHNILGGLSDANRGGDDGCRNGCGGGAGVLFR